MPGLNDVTSVTAPLRSSYDVRSSTDTSFTMRCSVTWIQWPAGPVHFMRLPVSVTLSHTCVTVVVFPVDSPC